MPSHTPSASLVGDSTTTAKNAAAPPFRKKISIVRTPFPAGTVPRIAFADLSRNGSPTMEKSLDQLIEHLLGEIALCGPAGELHLPVPYCFNCTIPPPPPSSTRWRPVRVPVRAYSIFTDSSTCMCCDSIADFGAPDTPFCHCRFLYDFTSIQKSN